ncbi:MAG: NUDIX domain-containing protein [Candidatus Paceibacterota bacterium]
MRLPIVNEEDEIIGYKDRTDRNPKDIIRVSGLWLTDSAGNILLAQRALNKKTHAGLWGPAVAGTVEEGETYESNIIKEAEEEIGLKDLKLTPGPKIRISIVHEHFAQWFNAVIDHDYPFVKQDDEVEAIRWCSPSEFKQLVDEKPEIFIPDFHKYVDLLILVYN